MQPLNNKTSHQVSETKPLLKKKAPMQLYSEHACLRSFMYLFHLSAESTIAYLWSIIWRAVGVIRECFYGSGNILTAWFLRNTDVVRDSSGAGSVVSLCCCVDQGLLTSALVLVFLSCFFFMVLYVFSAEGWGKGDLLCQWQRDF